MAPFPLTEIHDSTRFGGKAAHLGAVARAGLRVPRGIGLSVGDVEELCAAKDDAALEALAVATKHLGGPLAVRSSAPAEDSAPASFAGLLHTSLNVIGLVEIADSVRRVRASAQSAGATLYRQRMGMPASNQSAVLIQEMVDSVVAGVLFTRDPLDGADVTVIEAAWGLGVAVVMGLVIPDVYRVTASGTVSRKIGRKNIAVRARPAGGTEESPVAEPTASAPTLNDAEVAALGAVGRACEGVLGCPADVEWAVDAERRIHVLQVRPITGRRA